MIRKKDLSPALKRFYGTGGQDDTNDTNTAWTYADRPERIPPDLFDALLAEMQVEAQKVREKKANRARRSPGK